MSSKESVRTLILPLQGVTALLPQAVIAEILSFHEPEVVDHQEGEIEILGMIDWHHYRVPLITLENTLGGHFTMPGAKAKILICNALNSELEYQVIAIVVESVPRVLVVEDGRRLPAGQERNDFARSSRYQGELVWIPDIEKIGRLVNEQLVTD